MNRREPKSAPCVVTKFDVDGNILSVTTTKGATTEHRRSPRMEGSVTRKSERSMTDTDAKRVMYGDLKDQSHGNAAKVLGLSYGQVYSARGGYTFKHVKGA